MRLQWGDGPPWDPNEPGSSVGVPERAFGSIGEAAFLSARGFHKCATATSFPLEGQRFVGADRASAVVCNFKKR